MSGTDDERKSATMAISSALPEYIRSLVRGDTGANNQVEATLDAEGWEGFPRYLAAVFFLAVDRRFPEDTASSADVITFVAELRAGLSDGGPDIKPEAAEALITSIIDPSVDYTIDQQMIGRIQAATVYKILTELNLSDEELDALLREALDIATRPAG